MVDNVLTATSPAETGLQTPAFAISPAVADSLATRKLGGKTSAASDPVADRIVCPAVMTVIGTDKLPVAERVALLVVDVCADNPALAERIPEPLTLA
jgi:hypothetical protein